MTKNEKLRFATEHFEAKIFCEYYQLHAPTTRLFDEDYYYQRGKAEALSNVLGVCYNPFCRFDAGKIAKKIFDTTDTAKEASEKIYKVVDAITNTVKREF